MRGQHRRVTGRRLRASDERGVALLIAMMAIVLVMALGTALLLAAGIEARIARNFAGSTQALYAAEAGIEQAVDDLRTVPDWNAVLAGAVRSAFVDGPGGPRNLSDGRRIDIAEVANLANCRRPGACSDAELDAVTAARPRGPDNPRWQPFAWGPLNAIVPGGADSPFFIVVLVADDPSENDGNPLVDGSRPCDDEESAGECNPGTGVIVMRSEAFGPFGAHRAIEATLVRPGPEIRSWRELR
jgi:hypothetical protein